MRSTVTCLVMQVQLVRIDRLENRAADPGKPHIFSLCCMAVDNKRSDRGENVLRHNVP